MTSLRRLGYLTHTRPQAPMLAILERAGLRPRPLNRAEPWHGHWICRCPLCGRDDGAYVEPGAMAWSTLCQRGQFSIYELHAALMAGVAA